MHSDGCWRLARAHRKRCARDDIPCAHVPLLGAMSVRAAPAEPAAAHGASRLAAVLAAGMARLSLLPTGVKKGKEKASPLPAPTPEERAALQSVISKKKHEDQALTTLIGNWLDNMKEKQLRSMMPNVIDWKSPWVAEKLDYFLHESGYALKNHGRDYVQNRIRKEVKRRVALIDKERAKKSEENEKIDVDEEYLDEFAVQDDDPKDYVDEAHLLEHLDTPS